jgi:hypothetical protein
MYTGAMLKIPREVQEQLGIYVYAYIDPRTSRVFYIGKGQAGRVISHLTDEGENCKHALIEEIRAAGQEPRLDIVQHGIPDEERIETALIDMLGLDVLTNDVHGWRYKFLGRSDLPGLIGRYSRPLIRLRIPYVQAGRVRQSVGVRRHGRSRRDQEAVLVWKCGGSSQRWGAESNRVRLLLRSLCFRYGSSGESPNMLCTSREAWRTRIICNGLVSCR